MNKYQNVFTIDLKLEANKNKGKAILKSPREHKIEAQQKMNSFYKENGKRGILVLPTGAGKTYTAVYWILKNILSKKIKVLWLKIYMKDWEFLAVFQKRSLPNLNLIFRK